MIFYFDRRKCIQRVNFASKFTIIAVDIKEDIVLFGFSIWGTPFEEFKDFLKENTNPAGVQMSMF